MLPVSEFAFGERMDLDAGGAEIVEHRYQVAQTTAQPVELPYNERVAVFQLFQASEKDRALGCGS